MHAARFCFDETDRAPPLSRPGRLLSTPRRARFGRERTAALGGNGEAYWRPLHRAPGPHAEPPVLDLRGRTEALLRSRERCARSIPRAHVVAELSSRAREAKGRQPGAGGLPSARRPRASSETRRRSRARLVRIRNRSLAARARRHPARGRILRFAIASRLLLRSLASSGRDRGHLRRRASRRECRWNAAGASTRTREELAARHGGQRIRTARTREGSTSSALITLRWKRGAARWLRGAR
jgi:hypothetical protein